MRASPETGSVLALESVFREAFYAVYGGRAYDAADNAAALWAMRIIRAMVGDDRAHALEAEMLDEMHRAAGAASEASAS